MTTHENLTRRDVLKAAAAIGVAAAVGAPRELFAQSEKRKATIGIQMDVGSLIRPDVDKLFDDMQTRAGVNTLLPFICTYVNRTSGLPAAGFRGGNYAIPHMQYYNGSGLTFEDMRAPEVGDLDVLAKTIEGAKKRGIKTFAWILENNERVNVANFQPFCEIDWQGRRREAHPSGACSNNPKYRAYLLGMVEDYTRSFDIDGVMWSSERQGGLWNALGAWHHGRANAGEATCFCEYCIKKAKDKGIGPERAKKGFAALEPFVLDGQAGKRPRDGYFVTFMRILLNYPELLAWEKFWIDSRQDLQQDIYNKVKSIKPELPVGWHIWHNVSFSPFHRAEMDFSEIAKFSDFIKPVLYSNCAGERIKSFADCAHRNVFGDLQGDQELQMLYKMLDYPNEATYDQVLQKGLTPDYVERETRRTAEDAALSGRKVEIWPGIDVDVPVPAGASQCTAEYVKQTVLAAFKGGAQGVVLSRNYSEMNPDHLAGAGAALKELGIG